MSRSCSSCGAQISDAAATCPACNAAVSVGSGAAAAPAQAQASGLTDNLAGALAYVTIIPAIIFLIVPPYNQNRFIKFHSLQSILFAIGAVVVGVGLSIVASVLSAIFPLLGLIMVPIDLVVAIAFFVGWLLCLVKAYGNQMFRLPVVGNIAASQVGA